MTDSRIINVRRLSYELSGAVDGVGVCPQCGESATPSGVIAPPVSDSEFESELLRQSALSDDHVDVRFEPCGDEVDIREIDGLDVRIRDGPIEIDYDPSPV